MRNHWLRLTLALYLVITKQVNSLKANDSESSKVLSPFSGSAETFPQASGTSRKNIFLAAGLTCFLLCVAAVGVFFLMGYLNDPYRTMEPFPVSKFLDSPRALLGSKFQAELRVEANLAYKDEVGRLMLFSTSEDSRPVAVMVPDAVAQDIYFTKGQTYMAELEVKEGGLIYANSCKKN